MALAIALTGLFDVLSALYLVAPAGRLGILSRFIATEVQYSSRTVTVIAGFVLLAISWRLALGKREAWKFTAWTLVVTSVTHLTKGLDIEWTIAALFLLVLLFLWRKAFTVRSDPWALDYLLFIGPFAVLFILAYILLGSWLFRAELFPRHYDISVALSEGLNLLTWGKPMLRPKSRRAIWFLHSLYWLGPAAIAYITWALTRPIHQAHDRTRRDEMYVRLLLHAYGQSPVSYFSLMPDKSFFFDTSEEVVVVYKLVGNVPVVLSDPIGPEEKIAAALEDWLATCEENDWLPAFYQATERYLPVYQSAGLRLLKIGEDATIPLQNWTLSGKKKQNLRTALHQGERRHWSFLLFNEPIADEKLVQEIKAVSEAWLGGRSELSFSMGGTHIEGNADERLACVLDAQGTVLGFLTWAPIAQMGWNLDLMRRRFDAPHGLMEYLITQSLLQFQEEGYTTASLGMAPLANISDGVNDFPLLAKALELVYEKTSSVYAYKSLHDFKAKFVPDWQDRYLVYSSNLAAPQVLYAVVKAHIRDGSLVSLLTGAAPPPQKVVMDLLQLLNRQKKHFGISQDSDGEKAS